MRTTGRTLKRTIAGEEIATFVPYPLPPRDPPLIVDGKLAALLTRAEQALARLEVAGELVPSLDWFIYAFVRKEAVVSSQIEGTQATLIDLSSTKPSRRLELTSVIYTKSATTSTRSSTHEGRSRALEGCRFPCACCMRRIVV
jgi:Fic family protein